MYVSCKPSTIFFLKTLLVLVDAYSALTTQNKMCSMKPQPATKYLKQVKTYSILTDFNTFDELVLDCDHFYNVTELVEFLPRRTLIVDKSFRIDKILKQDQLNKIVLLVMLNVRGFAIDTYVKKIITANMIVSFSTINFYNNGRLIQNETECGENSTNETSYYIAWFFGVSFVQVRYASIICPRVFSNSLARNLVFKDISNSFLDKNRFRFIEPNAGYSHAMKYLSQLEFGLKYERLDTTIMSRSLFANVKSLKVSGLVNEIETRLFAHFNKLRFIMISIDNLKRFFEKGNEWMAYLNTQVDARHNYSEIYINKNWLKIRFEIMNRYASFNTIYTYPDEDFCLFKHFPHQRLVFPMLVFDKKMQ